MRPLATRVLTWTDVPEAWRTAIGEECERVMFVPLGQTARPEIKGRLADIIGETEDGTLLGWLVTPPPDPVG